jgi:hypothetical protein
VIVAVTVTVSALCSLLDTDNKQCLVEATRVYGNLTRAKDARDFLVESGAWDQILKFLDWDDQELLCTTVGILVNMMADWDKRIALKEGHGVERYFTETSVVFKCYRIHQLNLGLVHPVALVF